MIGGYVGGIGVPLHVGDGITAILDIKEAADTISSAAHSGFGSRIAMAHIGGRAGLNVKARGGTRIRAA